MSQLLFLNAGSFLGTVTRDLKKQKANVVLKLIWLIDMQGWQKRNKKSLAFRSVENGGKEHTSLSEHPEKTTSHFYSSQQCFGKNYVSLRHFHLSYESEIANLNDRRRVPHRGTQVIPEAGESSGTSNRTLEKSNDSELKRERWEINKKPEDDPRPIAPLRSLLPDLPRHPLGVSYLEVLPWGLDVFT